MTQCAFCIHAMAVTETRDGRPICENCADKWNHCEICGSIAAAPDADPGNQLHFEEECFK